MEGFATVGIIGLVDEATGYQYTRERDALATVLEAYIEKEAAAWVKTFPDEFYSELFRLRGVDPENLHKRPGYFGSITNDIVYKRLAPAVLEELKKKNPKKLDGKRLYRHFQWLTKHRGVPELRSHIKQLLIIMRESNNWKEFMKKVDKYLPVFEDAPEVPAE